MDADRPTDPQIAALAERLRPVWISHSVLRAILFGSLARGEGTRRSDVDLLVVQETGRSFLDRYDDLLAEVTRRVPGRDVDLLIYTPAEVAEMAERPLIAAALREGVVIYESGQEQVQR